MGCPFALNSVRKKLPAVTSAAATSAGPIAATASATAAAAEVITFGHRLGFVDGQRAPIELRAIKGLNGLLG